MPDNESGNIYKKPPIGMGPNGKPFRAMIIDDSKTVRTMLKQMLLSVSFEIAAEAESGEMAVITVEKTAARPDFCFVDIEMPGINGMETVQRLKPLLPDCVFIMATSRSEKEFVMEALDLGVAGYIVKPFNRDTVLLQIGKIIKKK